MTLRMLSVVALFAAMCAMPAARAELPAGISGSWYNPAQSGHGLSVEILSDERALVFWYAYDSHGAPLFLYIEAEVQGHSLVGRALAPRGMRFGAFDPAELQRPVWGQVQIDFVDCDSAVLRYQAQDSAFGAGSVPLTRLTRIWDSTCSLEAPQERLEAGVYRAWTVSGEFPYEAHVAIDESGHLFGIETRRDEDGIPRMTYHGPEIPALITGTADAGTGALRYRLNVQANLWINGPWAPQTGELVLDGAGRGSAVLAADPFPRDLLSGLVLSGKDTQRQLVDDVNFDDLAGQYDFRFGDRIAWRRFTLRIDNDGGLCLESVDYRPGCISTGHLSVIPGNAGFFDFDLGPNSDFDLGAHSGRGWLEAPVHSGTQPDLVFFEEGSNPRFGFVAVRR